MSDIGVAVNYEGTQQGAQQLDQLLDRLGHLLTAEERAAVSSQHLERAFQDQAEQARRTRGELAGLDRMHATVGDSAQGMAQRVNVVEGKVEAFGSALGTLGSTMGQISPELAHVGEGFSVLGDSIGIATSMPGPFGLALAGLNGVLGAVSIANQVAEERTQAFAEAQRTAADATRDLVQALREQREVQAIETGEASVAEIEDSVRRARDVRDVISNELREARAELRVREEALSTGGRGSELGRRLDSVEAQRSAVEDLTRSLSNAQRGYEELVDAQTTAASRELAAGSEDDSQETAEQSQFRSRGPSGPSRADRDEAANRELGADVFAELDGVQALRDLYAEYDEERSEALERRAEEEKAKLDESIALEEERERARLDAIEAEVDARKEAAEEMDRIESELAERRLDEAREITDRIAGTLTQVATAYIDAFGQAIEGQKTLEEAAIDATKALLKSIGEEMVALGIKETLEGFANLVSRPDIAATKIPMGIALVAAGAGLGAAGAAIPSEPSAPPESPRSDAGDGGGGGDMTLVINNNQPIVSTGTHAQLSRQMQRQIRDGMEIPTRV